MKRLKLFFLGIIIAVAITSCTVEEHVHFNKDLQSGTVEYSIDMSMLFAMYQSSEMDMNIKDSLDAQFGEDSPLQDIKGISNFKNDFDLDNGIMSFSYSFNNLNALNESLTFDSFGENTEFSDLMGKEANTQTQNFRRKKKFLFYEGNKVETTGEEADPMFEGMNEMFKYKVTFEFEKPIKKFNNKNYMMSSDKKTIEMEGNMLDMFSGKMGTDFKAKF